MKLVSHKQVESAANMHLTKLSHHINTMNDSINDIKIILGIKNII